MIRASRTCSSSSTATRGTRSPARRGSTYTRWAAIASCIQGITFFSARDDDGMLLGVGALNELDTAHGEVKSMHTAERRTACA